MTNESLRTRVRVWLAKHDKNQDWLAQQIGISQPLLSRVLSGYLPFTEELEKKIRTATGLHLKRYVTETPQMEVRS